MCERMSTRRQIGLIVLVAFLQLIPQSTLTTAFPTREIIGHSFQISDPSILPWLVAGYSLSFGAFILPSGRLGDIFGQKPMVVLGFSLMGIFAIVAGLSHYDNIEVFFIARGFQGVAAAMLVPNGLAILGRTYPPTSKQKVIAFSIFGLCAPLGAYLGMLFGAVFAQLLSWWWSYYTLAIVSTVLAISAQLILISPPKMPPLMEPTWQKLGRMDWYGAIFGVSGLVLIQFSLISAPTKGWGTPYIYFCLIIGLLMLLFFLISQVKIASQPLVPFKLLKAEVVFVLVTVSCGWATFGVWSWYLWRWLLDVKLYSPLEAAQHAVPIVPVAMASSVTVAVLMRKVPPAAVLFIALAAFTIGCVLLAAAEVRSPYWTFTFLSLVITPWGMNLSYSSATIITSNHFPLHQQGIAGSLITTCVNYSISLGLGLASTVEVHVDDHGLRKLAGIRGGFYFGIGIGSLGILICTAFLMRSIIHARPVRKKQPEPLLTQQVTLSPKRNPSDLKFPRNSFRLSHQNPNMKDVPLLEAETSRPTTSHTTRTNTPEIPLPTELQSAARSRRMSFESGHHFRYPEITALPTWESRVSQRSGPFMRGEEKGDVKVRKSPLMP